MKNKIPFNNEGELLQYIYAIMPFAIKPKGQRKHKLVSPFTSAYAFEQICKHLSRKLFSDYNDSLKH